MLLDHTTPEPTKTFHFACFLTLILLVHLCSCSENTTSPPVSKSAVVESSGRLTEVVSGNNVDEKETDTCYVDVFISPAELAKSSELVNEKLILEYEYCKVLYSPKVVINEDTLKGHSYYLQVWPPLLIKATLFAKRGDSVPYSASLYMVQKDKEEYRIEQQPLH